MIYLKKLNLLALVLLLPLLAVANCSAEHSSLLYEENSVFKNNNSDDLESNSDDFELDSHSLNTAPSSLLKIYLIQYFEWTHLRFRSKRFTVYTIRAPPQRSFSQFI
jgi:hypothetical protein